MIHMWEYGGGLDTMVEVGARTECREYTYGLSVVTRAGFLLIDKAKSIALNGELERAVGMKEYEAIVAESEWLELCEACAAAAGEPIYRSTRRRRELSPLPVPSYP